MDRDSNYRDAIEHFGPALDRIAVGYEADLEKRRDLRQEIHFQLWRSFEIYDGRCSLKTWTFRVAHNTAVSYAQRERRGGTNLVALEQVEELAGKYQHPDVDHVRSLEQLHRFIRGLKPLDRQIILCYLEEMEGPAIADITGLSPANVAMKVHRIKSILTRAFGKERNHA